MTRRFPRKTEAPEDGKTEAATSSSGGRLASAAMRFGGAFSAFVGRGAGASSSSGTGASSDDKPPAKRQRLELDGRAKDDQPGDEKPLAPAFCTWEGSYGDLLTTHLHKDCQCEAVPCPLGCGIEIKRGDVEFHKSTVCSRVFEECKICGKHVKSWAMEFHRQEDSVTHANILEKQNKEYVVKIAALEKSNAALTNANAELAQLVKTNSDLTKANGELAKTNSDLVSTWGPQINNSASEISTLLSLGLGKFSAAWTLNVADALKTCTKTDDCVRSERFSPIPQMAFEIRMFPHGQQATSGKVGVYLALLTAGASWSKGVMEFEISCGENKFPKITTWSARWDANSVQRGWGRQSVMSTEDLKKTKTVNIVVRHRAKPGQVLEEKDYFKLKTLSQ